MIELDGKLLSADIFKKEFVCNLGACKGACCVEGNAGAPLDEEEAKLLDQLYPKFESYLTDAGRVAVQIQGKSVQGIGELETPLINGKECAYTVFSDSGTASCGIEKAYQQGVIDFQKPISCHLYPVRVQEYQEMTAVNYHSWSICSDACALGKSLKIPVYQFVKTALIRKFGADWYTSLRDHAKKSS